MSEATIELGRVEGIDTAEELLLKLRSAADDHSEIQIDASNVVSLDSTTLQMLVVFLRETIHEGANVSWVNPSAKMKKTAELLGLTGELNF